MLRQGGMPNVLGEPLVMFCIPPTPNILRVPGFQFFKNPRGETFIYKISSIFSHYLGGGLLSFPSIAIHAT